MKRLVFAISLIVAGPFHQVAHADADAPIECFSSPDAVHEAHPGSHAVYTTHATWWTESSKCWFVGEPVAKPKTKPRAAAATVAAAPSLRIAQGRPPQAKQEVPVALEENVVAYGTYEENAAALRALMFGEDESPTDFEGRFSALEITPTFDLWRRCFATPTWDLCQSST
jgi:hypothetical protein